MGLLLCVFLIFLQTALFSWASSYIRNVHSPLAAFLVSTSSVGLTVLACSFGLILFIALVCVVAVGSVCKTPERLWAPGRKSELSTQTKLLDQRTVTVDIGALEVIEQAAAGTDHHLHTTTGVVIMLVLLQVLGQIGDALGEQGNLDLRGTSVALVGRELVDDLGLFFSRQCHGILLILLRGAASPMPTRSLSAGETRQTNMIHDGRTKKEVMRQQSQNTGRLRTPMAIAEKAKPAPA